MICLIPARGGSTRIPRKNTRDFHGQPIIAWSISLAIRSGLFDRVIVTTENGEIAAIASSYGASVHIRSAEMAQDEIGTQEVAQSAFKRLNPNDTYSCVLYATAPLLLTQDLLGGFDRLKTVGTDYVISKGRDDIDAGAFYFGKTKSFITGVPLEGNHATFYLDDDRVCDINTLEDWNRAEKIWN